MKIGRLEIRWAIRLIWHKPKKKSIYGGVICDICGQRVLLQEKGTHIIEAHPEYQVKRIRVKTSEYGGYLAYECGFCGYRITSPAFMIRHIQEQHSQELLGKEVEQ